MIAELPEYNAGDDDLAEIASINFTRVLRDGYFRISKSAARVCLCGLRRLLLLDVAGIGQAAPL